MKKTDMIYAYWHKEYSTKQIGNERFGYFVGEMFLGGDELDGSYRLGIGFGRWVVTVCFLVVTFRVSWCDGLWHDCERVNYECDCDKDYK